MHIMFWFSSSIRILCFFMSNWADIIGLSRLSQSCSSGGDLRTSDAKHGYIEVSFKLQNAMSLSRSISASSNVTCFANLCSCIKAVDGLLISTSLFLNAA